MPLALTYTTLTTELQKFLGDEDTAFVARIPTLIGLGEMRALRDLDLEIFDVTSSTIAFSTSNQLVTKPDNWVATRTLAYKSGSVVSMLLPRTYEYLLDYWPNATLTGTPLYFTELNATQWMVAPTPAADTAAGVARYVKRPAGLDASTTSTWLSANAADVLLYACLVSAVEWSKHAESIKVWGAEYGRALEDARKELKHAMRQQG